MSSTNSPDWQGETIRHWTNMAKIKQWLGVTAAQALEDEADRQQKNREAEESLVRRQVWQAEEQPGEDEMRQTILGDYHNTQTLPSRPASSLAPALLGMGLLAAGTGLPAAAYLYSLTPQPVKPAPPISLRTGLEEDTSIKLTLPDWTE